MALKTRCDSANLWRQEDQESKVIFSYIPSLRLSWATRDTASKNIDKGLRTQLGGRQLVQHCVEALGSVAALLNMIYIKSEANIL